MRIGLFLDICIVKWHSVYKNTTEKKQPYPQMKGIVRNYTAFNLKDDFSAKFPLKKLENIFIFRL